MGRKTIPEGCVTRVEAAALLHVSLPTFDRFVKQRLLTPQLLLNARNYLFQKADVQQLALHLTQKTGDLGATRALAMQAISATKVLERRLAEVFEFLGLSAEPLPRDADSIRELARELKRPIAPDQVHSPEWVKARAAQFFSMDQWYFALAGEALGDDEPWKRYIDYVLRLKKYAHEYIDSVPVVPDDLVFAYKYLDGALKNLNDAGFLYCSNLYGRRTANRVFGAARTAAEEIELLLRH